MRIKLHEPRQLWLPLVNSIVPFRSQPKEVGLWDRYKEFEAGYWENEDIIRCHAFLLEESVKELFDGRTSARTRLEVIEWINDDSSPGRPFSFQVCCELFNADHEIVRSNIFGMMERQPLLH